MGVARKTWVWSHQAAVSGICLSLLTSATLAETATTATSLNQLAPLPPASPPLTPPLGVGVRYPLQITAIPPMRSPQPFFVIPVVGLSEEITDNATVSPSDRQIDLVSTLELSFLVQSQSRRSSLQASGAVDYQKFVSTPEFDSYGSSVLAVGQVEVIDRLLFADARFSTNSILFNPSIAPATSRAIGTNQLQQTTYDVGVLFRETFRNLVDLSVRGRTGIFRFDDLGTTPSPIGVPQTTIDQGLARLTTGDHVRNYQTMVSGEYLTQRDGVRLYNAVYSLFVGEAAGLRLIGRVGYENIEDPGITDLQGTIWSGGVQWARSPTTNIRVEYGHRYGKPIWSTEGVYAITGMVTFVSAYQRTFEPIQARLRRSLPELTGLGDRPVGLPTLPGFIQTQLIGATALHDDYGFGLSWFIDAPTPQVPVGDAARPQYIPEIPELQGVTPGTTLIVEAGKTRTRADNFDVSTVSVGARLTRTAARRVSLFAETGYSITEQILPLVGESEIYRVQIGGSYLLARLVFIEASFTSQITAPSGSDNILENVIGVSLRKRL